MNRADIPKRPKGRALQYRETRQEIRTGDVLLFQGTSAVSRFIRWGSKSPYSHAGLAMWWNDRLLVVQSATRGVEILPASTAVERYDGQVDWWQPRQEARAQVDFKALINAAFDELGKPFAVLPLVALVARMFKGEEWGNPDAGPNDHSYFCSQLVSRCYRKAGMDLVPNKADQDTSPGDLSRCGHLNFLGVLHQHPLGVAPVMLPVPAEAAGTNIKAA